MPVMTGEEAVKRIREGEAGEVHVGVPVVALTAHALEGDRERFLEAGMNGYLAKPIHKRDLLEQIQLYLQTGKRFDEQIRQRKKKGKGAFAMEKLIDLGKAKKVMEDMDLVQIILESFEESVTDDFRKLQQVVKEGKAKEVERLAHSIKSVYRSLGSEQPADFFYRIEQAGRDQDLPTAAAMQQDAEQMVERSRQEVRILLKDAPE